MGHFFLPLSWVISVWNPLISQALQLLEENKSSIKYNSLSTNDDVSKISVIGVGMKSQSGVAKKMFQTLASKQINILAISTSEIKISVLINKKYTSKGKIIAQTKKVGEMQYGPTMSPIVIRGNPDGKFKVAVDLP